MAHAAEQPVGRLAFSAPAHCLTGCAIGKVLGMVLGVVAYPINRWLIARCRGHAVVHAHMRAAEQPATFTGHRD
jgi:hypothetical protein